MVYHALFQQPVGVSSWVDIALVTMVSTVHEVGAQINRNRTRPGQKTTNAKSAGEFFGDDWEKDMPIPCCIDDYNHYMEGVDIADQLRSYYDTELTSFRT